MAFCFSSLLASCIYGNIFSGITRLNEQSCFSFGLLPASRIYLFRDHTTKQAIMLLFLACFLHHRYMYLFRDHKTKQGVMLFLLACFLHHGYIFSGIPRVNKQSSFSSLLASCITEDLVRDHKNNNPIILLLFACLSY